MNNSPFEVTVLGSGSATPTYDRSPTSQVLNIQGHFFLIDCGEGTQIQLRRNNINFSKINRIFISHLHGDHFYGLIGLISTFNLLGLKNDIHIYSASELKDLIQPMLDYMKGDMLFKVIFHPLNFKKPQQIYSDKKVEIFSFPVKHSIPTCGFLFKEIQKPLKIRKECIELYGITLAEIKNIKAGADFVTSEGKIISNEHLTTLPPPPRSYAFCTDTAYFEPITETIKGVDLLYHEATFPEEMREWAHKTLHSTAKEAARIAVLAGAKKLLIGHFSARYKEPQVFENEAQEVFKNSVAVKDGKTYTPDNNLFG
jgi:ribonuclease Z